MTHPLTRIQDWLNAERDPRTQEIRADVADLLRHYREYLPMLQMLHMAVSRFAWDPSDSDDPDDAFWVRVVGITLKATQGVGLENPFEWDLTRQLTHAIPELTVQVRQYYWRIANRIHPMPVSDTFIALLDMVLGWAENPHSGRVQACAPFLLAAAERYEQELAEVQSVEMADRKELREVIRRAGGYTVYDEDDDPLDDDRG